MGTMTFQQVSVNVGSEICFGRYPMKADGQALPVPWLVMDICGGRALLLSKYVLDIKPFHDTAEAICWKNASLRTWLNRDFPDAAFSAEEKQRILPSVRTESPEWEARWNLTAKDTPSDALADAVFLFSSDDVNRFFLDGNYDYTRAMAQPTAWTAARFPECVDQSGHAKWWLRSTASKMPLALFTHTIGAISACGVTAQLGVRPAMWVLLDGMEYHLPDEKKVEESYVPEYHAGLAPVGESTVPPQRLCSRLKTGNAVSPEDCPLPEKGDIVTLGTYPQGKNGEVYPIEWVVLESDGKNALLLSRYILDVQRFSAQKGDPYWGHSHLRAWLADSFLKTAFSQEEMRHIRHPGGSDPGSAENYTLWKTEGLEIDTETLSDTAFLPSFSDISRFFPGDNQMFCPGAVTQITPWAYETYAREVAMDQLGWWLRSSSNRNDFAYIISPAESIGITANPHESLQGVRPAVRFSFVPCP